MKAASPEPVTSVVASAPSVSPMPYTVNGYETLRYLVPVQPQQQQQFVLMQQPMVQQVVSPVYLQNLQSLQHLSVSSQDSDLLLLQHSAAEVSGAAGTTGREADLGGKQSEICVWGGFRVHVVGSCGVFLGF